MPQVCKRVKLTTPLPKPFHTVNVDFVDLSWNFTFTSSSPDLLCVDVVTIDDSIPELPEKLVLEFATEPDPHVSVEPHFIEVLIINDDGIHTHTNCHSHVMRMSSSDHVSSRTHFVGQ